MKDIYSEETDKLIREYLIKATKENRIIINEWRNFIDYDILPLIKKIIEENNGI